MPIFEPGNIVEVKPSNDPHPNCVKPTTSDFLGVIVNVDYENETATIRDQDGNDFDQIALRDINRICEDCNSIMKNYMYDDGTCAPDAYGCPTCETILDA